MVMVMVMVMVIKGTSCAGARRLAVHLMRTDTNERAEVKELRGVTAIDLRGALLEMEAVAAGARTSKPFYHGSINTRAEERLTDAQRMQAIDRLEAALGLSGQPRVVVLHEKNGREHCHVVWSRVRIESMAAVSDSHNYRKHEEVARELEREFGHQRVQGAHVEREGKPRPKRTPSHAEMLEAERTGLHPGEARKLITELWRSTDSGRAFVAALEQHGWILARGDRRSFVVIDPKGGTHSLARRIDGATAKDVRERLADIDVSQLPTVAQAKKIQQSRAMRATGSVGKIPGPNLGWRAARAAAASRPPKGLRHQIAGQPGASPGPRSRPGESDSGSKGFGRYMARRPLATRRVSLPPVPHANAIRLWTPTEARTRGEFRAAALWVTSRVSRSDDSIGDAGDTGADIELEAIVADVQRKAEGARAGVRAEYAGKISFARQQLPRQQAAGAVRAFLEAQAAALLHIAREAAGEIAARRAAVIRDRRKERRPVRPSVWGGPLEGPNPN
jgi:hypothetical protein